MGNIKLIEEELLELEQENELLKGKLEKNLAREKYILKSYCIVVYHKLRRHNIENFIQINGEGDDYIKMVDVFLGGRQISDIGFHFDNKKFVSRFSKNEPDSLMETEYIYGDNYSEVLDKLKVMLYENNLLVKW